MQSCGGMEGGEEGGHRCYLQSTLCGKELPVGSRLPPARPPSPESGRKRRRRPRPDCPGAWDVPFRSGDGRQPSELLRSHRLLPPILFPLPQVSTPASKPFSLPKGQRPGG